MPLIVSLDGAWLKKDYLNLSICQQKLPKLKSKERKKKKPEQNIQELWNNYKRCNPRAVGIPEEGEKKTETEIILEALMTEKFSKLLSDTKLQIQVQITPSRISDKTEPQKTNKQKDTQAYSNSKKIKDKKEKNLEKMFEEKTAYLQKIPLISPQKPCKQDESGMKYLKC